MLSGAFYRQAGLLMFVVLLSVAESEGQRPKGNPPPPSSTGRPGNLLPFRPSTSMSGRPSPTRPKRPGYYSDPITRPLAKTLTNRLPTRPPTVYAFTPSVPRTSEWELVPIVVEGHVQSVRRATREGKIATNGSQLYVGLTVARVLKGSGVQAGEKVTIHGQATGDSRQEFIPLVGDDVVAFLRAPQNGRFDLLGTRGFRKRSSAGAAARGEVPDEP